VCVYIYIYTQRFFFLKRDASKTGEDIWEISPQRGNGKSVAVKARFVTQALLLIISNHILFFKYFFIKYLFEEQPVMF